MSLIVSDIRNVMQHQQQASIDHIWAKLTKNHPDKYGGRAQYTKDNVLETINFYKRLNVVYVDNDNNLILL